MRLPTSFLACLLAHAVIVASLRGQLVQVRQDFSQDPGWDHFQNRIVGTEMPTVVQDFGWRRTNYTLSGPGEIGGRVENSRRQAYYALPLGRPLSFNDEISASGKLVLRHIGLRGVGYIGFFNSRRHSWRVWSSMAFRVWEEDRLGQVMFDWMSSDYDPQADRAAGQVTITLDGREHRLDLSPQQRKSGAVFNRFGLANVRRGGHSVEFYLDDLTYTARRAPGARPAFIPQTTVEVPYPHQHGGRRY